MEKVNTILINFSELVLNPIELGQKDKELNILYIFLKESTQESETH